MMGIEAAPIELPQRKRSPHAAVSIGKGMNGLEPMVEDGRGNDRRLLGRLRVPPFQ